jgi:hypothetical protein
VIVAAKLQRLERESQVSFAREDVPNEPALEDPMRPAVSEESHLCTGGTQPR